jgi:hypothetical protein
MEVRMIPNGCWKTGMGLFLLLLCVFAFGEALTAVPSGGGGAMSGIYDLPAVAGKIDSRAAGAGFVTGYSIRTSWRRLEPKQGKYNWTYIDQSIALAKQKGKYVVLRVLAGMESPDWVKNDPTIEKMSFIGRDPNQAYYNQMVTVVKPWDPNYLKKWYAFLDTLAKRYRNEPLLYWVAVSGPVMSSATPLLPGDPQTEAEIKKQGYTHETWVAVWKEAIDRTAAAFPGKSVSLCLDPPKWDASVANELADYAVPKYGARICLQSNGLSAKWPVMEQKDPAYKQFVDIFRQYRGKATIGFQMTWAAAWANGTDRLGLLDAAIKVGLDLGATYLEIYQDDLIDPANAAILTDAAKNLGAAMAAPTSPPAPTKSTSRKPSGKQ